jgi:hypothetical protein
MSETIPTLPLSELMANITVDFRTDDRDTILFSLVICTHVLSRQED